MTRSLLEKVIVKVREPLHRHSQAALAEYFRQIKEVAVRGHTEERLASQVGIENQ